jgi:AMMECR1 domain-containing protein
VRNGLRRGLLLPDIEGVSSVEEQIAIAKAKGGILPEEPVDLFRFTVQRLR